MRWGRAISTLIALATPTTSTTPTTPTLPLLFVRGELSSTSIRGQASIIGGLKMLITHRGG